MTKLRNALSASILALALCSGSFIQANAAAVALVPSDRAFPQVVRVVAYGDVTAGSTFNATGYADLPGSNFTFTPTLNDETTAARLSPGLIEVNWSIDATKATSTTGTCAVFVNGAVVAASARTVGAVTEDVIGGDFMFPNTVVGPQTIKLQCKSGDTAVFTINFGHMIVREVIPASAR